WPPSPATPAAPCRTTPRCSPSPWAPAGPPPAPTVTGRPPPAHRARPATGEGAPRRHPSGPLRPVRVRLAPGRTPLPAAPQQPRPRDHQPDGHHLGDLVVAGRRGVRCAGQAEEHPPRGGPADDDQRDRPPGAEVRPPRGARVEGAGPGVLRACRAAVGAFGVLIAQDSRSRVWAVVHVRGRGPGARGSPGAASFPAGERPEHGRRRWTPPRRRPCRGLSP